MLNPSTESPIPTLIDSWQQAVIAKDIERTVSYIKGRHPAPHSHCCRG
ncbi:hypothetical protein [Pseudomonas sp. Fl4BN1]|nr:hypothetical protein [Pseudomonas sp. Fl4BN1]NBF08661.1 hypothetical protein [Pseudomonas sp. Fl4BN1]